MLALLFAAGAATEQQNINVYPQRPGGINWGLFDANAPASSLSDFGAPSVGGGSGTLP